MMCSPKSQPRNFVSRTPAGRFSARRATAESVGSTVTEADMGMSLNELTEEMPIEVLANLLWNLNAAVECFAAWMQKNCRHDPSRTVALWITCYTSVKSYRANSPMLMRLTGSTGVPNGN